MGSHPVTIGKRKFYPDWLKDIAGLKKLVGGEGLFCPNTSAASRKGWGSNYIFNVELPEAPFAKVTRDENAPVIICRHHNSQAKGDFDPVLQGVFELRVMPDGSIVESSDYSEASRFAPGGIGE